VISSKFFFYYNGLEGCAPKGTCVEIVADQDEIGFRWAIFFWALHRAPKEKGQSPM
jgi:hypothetical protein